MSGIVGSRLNIRGSGVVGKLGTDGQVLTSSGAGESAVFEAAGGGAVSAINNATANELVTIGSTTTELDSETNLTYNGTILGCGADGANADLGAGLHIKVSDTGGDAHADADGLVIEDNAHMGITLLTSASTESTINFGDANANRQGRIAYDHSNDIFNFYTNQSNNAMKIDNTGAVTKPLQPAFSANASAGQTGLSGTTWHTGAFNTEVFDVNADYNNSTYTFTAPVTGKYLFTVMWTVNNFSGRPYSYFNTSNRNYTSSYYGPGLSGNGDSYTGTTIADMDANDTCKWQIYAYDDSDWDLAGYYFTGALLC